MSNNTPKINIIVVQDEMLQAEDIANRLKDLNYNIIGIADSAAAALELISLHQNVDILFLDVVLKGATDGIELAGIINEKYNIPFIFLTSWADESIIDRAKKVKPRAYILKPFNDRQVSIAIELTLVNFSKKPLENELLAKSDFDFSENQVPNSTDGFYLKKNNHFEHVCFLDMLFLRSEANYTSIYTKSDLFIYSEGLNKIAEQLSKEHFIRVHRSYVVNINAVSGFEGNLLFISEYKIPVSNTYKEAVFNLFKNI
jgi:DNA-binding LytR/AlgR family response regulator